MKRTSKVEQQAFFIIFKGLSMKLKQFVLKGENPTLTKFVP